MIGTQGRARLEPLVLSLWIASASLGCRHLPALPEETVRELAARPGAYLEGEVVGIAELVVLNDQDFVYSLSWAPSSRRVAGIRLGARSYTLQLFEIPERAERDAFVEEKGRILPAADTEVNPYEFDVEAIEHSPDGKWLVTAGRDGAVRLFEAATAKSVAVTQLESPLSAVAFHPSGHFVIAGAADGGLTVLEVPSLRYSSELRAHTAELRALAFPSGRTLLSGGWDKSIAEFTVVEAPVSADAAEVRYEQKGAYSMLRGGLEDSVVLTFALDARVKHVIVRSEVARAAGIEPSTLGDTLQIPTAMGQSVARVAKNRALQLKGLRVEGIDIAICDACVPPEAQGVLGEPFLDQVDVAFDAERKLAVLTRKAPLEGRPPPAPRPGLTLEERARHTFAWHVNDFALDASGTKLAVAFSELPALRTREVYQREKRGELEPIREGNAAAVVEVASGRIVQKWSAHGGVVSTAALSPDGRTLASGGWDKRVLFHAVGKNEPIAEKNFGWSIRRVRFSPDGRFLGVAAWTPQNPVGDNRSEPALALFSLRYGTDVSVVTGSNETPGPTPPQ